MGIQGGEIVVSRRKENYYGTKLNPDPSTNCDACISRIAQQCNGRCGEAACGSDSRQSEARFANEELTLS